MKTIEIKVKLNQSYFTIPVNLSKTLKALGVLIFSFLVYKFVPEHELLTPAARSMLFIFFIAIGLWLTEPIPPFATSLVVIALEMFILGKPGGVLASANDYNFWQIFLQPIASSLMLIFMAGFIMAKAASKHKLDQKFVHLFFKHFAHNSTSMLIGIIVFTALFSMFMSNTATTAMMFALIMPILNEIPKDAVNLKKAIVLAVPFAANIGGVGTMIGSPPNLLAVGVLQNITPGINISFLDWMVFGVPLAVLLLGILFIVLRLYYPIKKKIIFNYKREDKVLLTWDALTVYVTFTLVVLLWLTEKIHKIPTGIIALLPIVVFTITNIINAKDINSISWNVMILVAGGLCIGKGIVVTGFDKYITHVIPFADFGPLIIALILFSIIVVLSNFMSNSAAANLLIPIAVSIAVISPKTSALVVALGASLAMSFPISTPPNSIAYDLGFTTSKDMLRCGSIITITGGMIIMSFLFFTGV